jgi:hypothetical protein
MALRLHPLVLIIRITKIITVHWWNDNPRKKNCIIGEKRVPLPLFPA